jgi:hypothetical protein
MGSHHRHDTFRNRNRQPPESSWQARIKHLFATLPSCELDQVFGLPLREGLIHPDELEAEAGLLLQALLEIGQATNMPLERLLAQIKKASPSISRRATVQRVLSAGMLTQLMNHHLQRGGIDSRLGHRQSAPHRPFRVPPTMTHIRRLAAEFTQFTAVSVGRFRRELAAVCGPWAGCGLGAL